MKMANSNHPCQNQDLALSTDNIKLVVAVALIDADGRVLINERPEGKTFAGYWEFPGGKIEKGETPEAALLRELQEELNITTSLGCFAPIAFASHNYDDFHLLMPLYICHLWQGNMVAREGQKLQWVKGHTALPI